MNIISKSIYEKSRKDLLDTKEAISWVQNRLNYHGYSLEVDGKWGEKTERLVRKFQKEEGLTEEGISKSFITKLEQVRTEVNRLFPKGDGNEGVIIINSGYRCEKWNKQVGGAIKSQHTKSNPLVAADIRSPGIATADLGKICDRIFNHGGVGLGGINIVHVDSRGHRARWWYDS